MGRDDIRNRHGDLTAYALHNGYQEERSWLTVGMVQHVVTLTLDREHGGYNVMHELSGVTTRTRTTWGPFAELDRARLCFKREVTPWVTSSDRRQKPGS